MFIRPLMMAAVVTAGSVAYAALLPQIQGESLGYWISVALLVFVPWFALAMLARSVSRISHVGFARLFLVLSFAIACVGVATSSYATNVPAVATVFASYGALALAASRMLWWIVQGFQAQRARKQ